jgi:glycosyltransferase involved in cell wall biosynthesis
VTAAPSDARRLHVLILNWKDIRNPDAGGSEIVLHELATRLARRHRVTWFCRSFPGASRSDEIDGVRIERRGGLLTTYLRAPLFYARMRPRPDAVLDVVNTLAWQSPLYARGRTVAYVHQLAEDVLLYHLPWPLSRLAYALERHQFLTYRGRPTIAVSESTRRDLVSFGFDPKRIEVVESGVDHRRYSPDPTRRSHHPSFVFVGRLAPMKRADLGIRALALVVDAEPDATLTIVGSGPELGSLRALAAELGVAGSVAFVTGDRLLDPAAEERKVELLRSAWALVLPSVKEGWGLVVVEAAACGTPAIATDVSGLRDSVRHEQTGLLVSGDPPPDELAAAMLRLARDGALRERLGMGALTRASELEWNAAAARVEQELLAVAPA